MSRRNYVVHNRNEVWTRRLLIDYQGKDETMRKNILLSILILTLDNHLSAAVWTGETWQMTNPESQGMNSAKLAQAPSKSEVDINDAIVIRNGYGDGR